jgi:hypothetical protein
MRIDEGVVQAVYGKGLIMNPINTENILCLVVN